METEIDLLTTQFLDLQGAAVLSVPGLVVVVAMFALAARIRLSREGLKRVDARATARRRRRHDIPAPAVAFVLLPVGRLVVNWLRRGEAWTLENYR